MNAGESKKKILILSNESGSGHKQTARVLAQALQRKSHNTRILSTFNELFIDLDFGDKFFGFSGEAIYNTVILKREASPLLYRFYFGLIHYLYRVPRQKELTRRLQVFFKREKPDLVISVIPIINQEIVTAIEKQCPCVILQTDLFEHEEQSWFWRKLLPEGVWFVKDSHPFQLSGTEKGYTQARNYNPCKHKVRQISGTVIDPRFLEEKQLDVEAERGKLGLNMEQRVGMFLYGGYPPERVLKLAKQLDEINVDAQFIFICGNNKVLQEALEKLPTSYRKVVVGYSKEIPHYMKIVDFLVGKSGPGTIMESIALGLPLLLDVSHVMPHESKNAPWVEEQNLGMSFKTARELGACISNLDRAEEKTTGEKPVFKNTAVFEVSALVDEII
ncbi:MAG: hypothetical protein KTR32_38295 [Granulosicoccus sp.]|nr:hypothetical protein [Granulosicoccus sp.]